MARRSRFNLLLLEEGEYLLEECTAVAFVVKPQDGGRDYMLDTKQLGRLRLCTRGISFEPDDHRLPLTKYPFRSAPGCPVSCAELPLTDAVAAALAAEHLEPGKLVCMQVQAAVCAKENDLIAPHKTVALADFAPASAAAPASPPTGRGGRGAAVAVRAPPLAAGAASHVPGRTCVVFSLLHTPVSSLAPLAQQLWSIQRQCAAGAHSSHERSALRPLLDSRRDGPFDMSVLSDFRERPLLPASPVATYAERVFPLVVCPGRLMVTERAVYLLPVAINCVAGSDAAFKWPLKDVKRVLRRRRLLRETGIELVLSDAAAAAGGSSGEAAGLSGGSGAGVLLAFANPAVRDNVYRVVLKVLRDRAGSGVGGPGARAASAGGADCDYDADLGDPPPHALDALTRAWQDRALSNAEYLMALNSAAGRTIADLTQYPVLPWVIADYTSPSLDLSSPASFRDLSKPIGALNTARLDAARARFQDMPRGAGEDPPFLWGTHYSTPGYCLHYLVRSMPEHMLHLQAGRFDAPDRLFFDVSSTWAGVTSTNADVKELIPEFYLSDGHFLQLPDGLDLGVRANGRRVGDVVLPPWAYGAADFVARCREALESEWVSSQLHLWIDLVFGFKQRGPAAEAADNLFYYLTYSDGVDVDGPSSDPERVLALQNQIAEYGQTPRQLFSHRHPARHESLPLSRGVAALVSEKDGNRDSSDGAASGKTDPTHAGLSSVAAAQVDGGSSNSDAMVVAADSLATGGALRFEWQRVAIPADALKVHTDTVTRLSAFLFDTANAGFVGLHVLSASRDGVVSLLDAVVPPPAETGSAALISPLCRVIPGIASKSESSVAALSPLLLLWSALHGAATPKPTPVSAAACDATRAVVFSACWNGSLYAHDANDSTTVLWQCAAHSAAVSDLVAVPLPRALLQLSGTGRGEEAPEGEDRYVIVSGAWDGSVGLACVSVSRTAAGLGTPLVRDCAAPVLIPGLHGAAVTAMGFCERSGAADVSVVTADAAGVLSWLRVRAHAAPGPRLPAGSAYLLDSARPSVVLTCDVLAKCTSLVDAGAAAKRTASNDAISGGVSGVSCLAIRPLASLSDAAVTSREIAPAGVLAVSCCVDGRLCVLCGTSSGAIGDPSRSSAQLRVIATVVTGEVLRCVAVDRNGWVAVTGGHRGRLRMWDLRRMRATATQALSGPSSMSTGDATRQEVEFCCADAELASDDSTLNLAATSSSGSRGTGADDCWITACALVEIAGHAGAQSEAVAPTTLSKGAPASRCHWQWQPGGGPAGGPTGETRQTSELAQTLADGPGTGPQTDTGTLPVDEAGQSHEPLPLALPAVPVPVALALPVDPPPQRRTSTHCILAGTRSGLIAVWTGLAGN